MKKSALTFLSFYLFSTLFIFAQVDAISNFKENSGKEALKNKIIGIHLLNYNTDEDLMNLSADIPALQKKGINTLFLEVDYHFNFESHPELISKTGAITKTGAQKFAKLCAESGMKIIPQFQSLGHQSWAENTWELLTVYPELDLTPGAFPNNDSIYCREWDVMNPRVNEIVFPMIEEIIDAFNSDGIHLGMDEVFLLGHKKSPSTKGMNPAFLYGKVVREFHAHFTAKKNKQLYIWGDRLIDAQKYGYGSWEAAMNGTHKAIDSIPKDIIICDWHYRTQKEYPSVDLFLEKGFKVLPCSWKDSEAATALIRYSFAKNNDNMLGHLYTLWGAVAKEELLTYESLNQGMETIKNEKYHEVFIKQAGATAKGSILVALSAANSSIEIRYTTDGLAPTINSSLYEKPFEYKKGNVVKAIPVKNGIVVGEMVEGEFVVHKAIGKKVTLLSEASDKYAAELQENTLVNGVEFTLSYSDGQWLGFEGKDCEFVVDLGKKQQLSNVSMNFHNKVNDWVHHPLDVVVYGSEDGKTYTEIGKKHQRKTGRAILNFSIPVTAKVRYVKVLAKNQIIPEGFNGAGNPAWLFIDEVVIE